MTKPLYELSAELYKQTEAAKGAEGTETAEGAKKLMTMLLTPKWLTKTKIIGLGWCKL